MIWWRRRRQQSPAGRETRQRLEEARAELDAARADTPRVEQVADELAELAARNHFGPLIAAALKGGRS